MRKYLVLIICLFSQALYAQSNDYTQQEITYDRRDGVSLTLTVLTPVKANGKGVISLLSGNWVSNYASFKSYRDHSLVLVRHGYTVFLVQHRSAPRYAIPDILGDIQRSVQFVRYHAADYHIDPLHIGITGTSSGGHLSLLAGLSKDAADVESKDPVARTSSAIQAVAVFCPPSDFLNYGKAGYNLAEDKVILAQFNVLGAFSYTGFDPVTKVYKPVTDIKQRLKIDSLMSPGQLVSKNSPPVYVAHGDSDPVVPIQQSQILTDKLKAAGVPVKLVVKPGAAHNWKEMDQDAEGFNAWFDQYLK